MAWLPAQTLTADDVILKCDAVDIFGLVICLWFFFPYIYLSVVLFSYIITLLLFFFPVRCQSAVNLPTSAQTFSVYIYCSDPMFFFAL